MTEGSTTAGDRLLRIAEVKARVALGKTKIYELIAGGRFPKPHKITAAAARWSEGDITAWIEEVKRSTAARP